MHSCDDTIAKRSTIKFGHSPSFVKKSWTTSVHANSAGRNLPAHASCLLQSGVEMPPSHQRGHRGFSEYHGEKTGKTLKPTVRSASLPVHQGVGGIRK